MQPIQDAGKKLAKINREAEERDARHRAKKLNLPYIDLSISPLEVDALSIISKEEAEKGKLAVLAKKGHDLKVVVYDSTLSAAQETIKRLEGEHYKLNISVGSFSGLEHVWNFYEFVHKEGAEITGKVEIDNSKLSAFREKLKTLDKAKEAVEEMARSGSVKAGELLEICLGAALTLRASDIHLEPEENGVRFRVRVDGALHDIATDIKKEDYEFLLSRIKLLSELKLNIHGSAQDGRFTIGIDNKEVEIRVSVLPSEYGETVVLRILDPETIQLTLADLGLRSDDLSLVEAELNKPNGMVLNTGPTGSGKTTTLYAFLLHVRDPESKIITIENPIEYRLEGIEQTQIDEEAGYTFENGLRAIVRQDPDVILVGEIRDFETAEIAMHAALTGHLVFSTLHTNDTFGSIPRLVDLGVKATVIGPALTLVIAQRLVRRLCPDCRVPAEPSLALKEKIKKFVDGLPARVNKDPYKEPKLFKAVGCEKCGNIGYKGRIAIFEFLQVNDELEQLIYKEVSEISIKEVAKKQGIVELQEDGILKAIEGMTTFAEVEDITGPIAWLAGEEKGGKK